MVRARKSVYLQPKRNHVKPMGRSLEEEGRIPMDYLVAPESHRTPDFLLRSYQPGDGRLLHDATHSSYDHLKTFIPWARPDQSPEEAERLAREFRGRWLLAQDFVVALLAPDESELWGGGGYHLREGGLSTGNAEIGMWIRASRARQGLGTRFLAALLEWGFRDWPWQRLSWRCDRRNAGSIRVAQKAGMKQEGLLESHTLAPSGERTDTVCFAILRSPR